MSAPDVQLNVLPHADGSVSYSWHGYDIVGSVNGPIEPQRRDELPQEAFIEVNVRPANGVGGTRERHIESIIHTTLRSIILTQTHPRTLIQVTLQVLCTPDTSSSAAPAPQSSSHLPLLPHLLHTALLALVAANIPLSNTYTAVLCAADPKKRVVDGGVRIFPTLAEVRQASSVHAFVYSPSGEALMIESEGRFDMEELDEIAVVAQNVCIGDVGRETTNKNGAEPLAAWLRRIVSEGVNVSLKWRGNL